MDEDSTSALHSFSHFLYFSQNGTIKEPADQEPARATEREDLHYGEDENIHYDEIHKDLHYGEDENIHYDEIHKDLHHGEEEDIHYGEIDFSKQRPQPPSASVQDSEQQQETLYAQVKLSQTARSLTQTADEPESLYAQVKKKRIE